MRTGLRITDRFGLLLNFGQEMQERERERKWGLMNNSVKVGVLKGLIGAGTFSRVAD